MLWPPTASSACSAPRDAAEITFFSVGTLSVKVPSRWTLPRNSLAVRVLNAAELPSTKFCVLSFSEPGSRSPGTPTNFTARPRGVETASSSTSPGVVDRRRIAGKRAGAANMPCAYSDGVAGSTSISPRSTP